MCSISCCPFARSWHRRVSGAKAWGAQRNQVREVYSRSHDAVIRVLALCSLSFKTSPSRSAARDSPIGNQVWMLVSRLMSMPVVRLLFRLFLKQKYLFGFMFKAFIRKLRRDG